MRIYKITLDIGGAEVFAYIEESTPVRALEVIIAKANERYGKLYQFKAMEALEGSFVKVNYDD